MEAVQEIHAQANASLTAAVERLDRDVRPTQRQYFACCFACSHPSRAPSLVPECLAACQAPMMRVQQQLQQSQEAFQGRIGACHKRAGEAVDDPRHALGKAGASARPSAAQLAQYAGALRPCVEAEVRGIGGLLEDVRRLVPDALKEIESATPATGRFGTWLW